MAPGNCSGSAELKPLPSTSARPALSSPRSAGPARGVVELLNKVFASAGTGALIPFASIGIGLAWSAWKDDIAASFLNAARPSAPNFSPHATAFWLLCLALLLLGVGSLWAKDRNSRRSSGEVKALLDGLGQQSKDLSAAINRVHSLPPVGVLEDARQMVDACEAYFDVANQIDPADPAARLAYEALIRKYLVVLGRFVRTFDGEHLHSSQTRYGLNVMIWLARDDWLGRPLQKALSARLRFASAGTGLDDVAGVLDIAPALSVAGGSDQPDPHLPRFAVPIAATPVPVDNAGLEQPALPGASRACVNFKHLAYGSVERLAHDMEQSGTEAALKAEMLRYFAEPDVSRHIRSFVCVPLFANETGVVGVLNIHRDTPNREMEDRLPMFEPLMSPARHQLARLLLKYKPLYSI